MHAYNFFVCGRKFTKILTPNVGEVVVDHLNFRLSFCWCIRELFTLKVDSCQKLRRILNVFPSQIFWGHPFQKLYSHCHACFAPGKVLWGYSH